MRFLRFVRVSVVHVSLSVRIKRFSVVSLGVRDGCACLKAQAKMARRLVVDCRERGLIQHLTAMGVPHSVESLAVGDVLCAYPSQGCDWVMERKRADDLAASIKDGRWREQSSRLFAAGQRVFFVVEGDLRWHDGGMYDAMFGAQLNANLRDSRCFRTMDVEETARLVRHLAQKLERFPAHTVSATGLRPPRTKRQREAEPENVFARQLMCVPSISERIAMCLVHHFGDLESLQAALRDVKTFPRVEIGGGKCVGKARVAKLRTHLVRAGAD